MKQKVQSEQSPDVWADEKCLFSVQGVFLRSPGGQNEVQEIIQRKNNNNNNAIIQNSNKRDSRYNANNSSRKGDYRWALRKV